MRATEPPHTFGTKYASAISDARSAGGSSLAGRACVVIIVEVRQARWSHIAAASRRCWQGAGFGVPRAPRNFVRRDGTVDWQGHQVEPEGAPGRREEGNQGRRKHSGSGLGVSQQSHQKVKHATNLPAGSPSFVAGGISRGLGLARALNIWDRFSLDAHSRIHRLGHPKCGRLGTADWTPSLLSLAWC